MSSDRKKEQRRRRRAEGFRPLEIWLPSEIIEKLDAMKTGAACSREAVILALVEDTVEVTGSISTGEPLLLQ